MGEWQRLLSVSDSIRKFCFAQPKTKDHVPWVFEHGDLAFLVYKKAQWARGGTTSLVPEHTLRNGKALARHWLAALNHIVVDATWSTLHDDYARTVEPWASSVAGAKDVFSKIPDIGIMTTTTRSNEPSTTLRSKYKPRASKVVNAKTVFTSRELVRFVDLYQQVRVKRAEAFAQELYRLAHLYDAHAARLKMPFDPRLHAPDDLNAAHIPTTMRCQARRLVRLAQCTRWRRSDAFKHRFAWPALIPYDWGIQLFNTVVQKPGFLDQDGAEEGPAEREAATVALVKQCRYIVASPPCWATGGPKTHTNAVARLSSKMGRQHLGEQAPDTSIPLCIRVDKTDIGWRELGKLHVVPRGEAELQWLQTFAEVTASMEQGYPNLL